MTKEEKLQESLKVQLNINNQLMSKNKELEKDNSNLKTIIDSGKTVYGFLLANETVPTVWGSQKTEFDTMSAKLLNIKGIT